MHQAKSPQSPPAGQPKYIQDYSKALQKELRILLDEVGKLRDERRSLQYEIAELESLRMKHSGGGMYPQPWMGPIDPGPSMPPPLPMEVEPAPPPEAKPSGWRVVHDRPKRKSRKAITGPKAEASQTPPPMGLTPPPPMGLTPPPPMPELPAWQNWRPNPLLAPTPVQNSAPLPTGPPPKQGLFGDMD